MWWQHVRAFYGHIKRLVIYLDNGPKNSGQQTPFFKRMVQFADWSGLGVTLGVLSALPQQVQSDRTLLVGPGEEMERCDPELPEGDSAMHPADDLEGSPPHREPFHGEYRDGVRVPAKEMKEVEARLEQ